MKLHLKNKDQFYKEKIEDRHSWFDKMDIIMQGIKSLYEHDPDLGKAFLIKLPEFLAIYLEGVDNVDSLVFLDPIEDIQIIENSETEIEPSDSEWSEVLLHVLRRIDILDCICIVLLLPVVIGFIIEK